MPVSASSAGPQPKSAEDKLAADEADSLEELDDDRKEPSG